MPQYPYTILPVTCPSKETAKKLRPDEVLEFFRIEALLRSEKVMKMYRNSTKPSSLKLAHQSLPDSVYSKYRVFHGFHVLKAAHHRFLEARDETSLTGGPIIQIHRLLGMQDPWLLERFTKRMTPPRYYWIVIDAAFPPEKIFRVLRHDLKPLHEASFNIPRAFSGWVPFRINPSKRPLIFGFRGIKTWLAYLRCYDLRYCEGLTFGEIAKQVYPPGGPVKRDLGEKAYDRVRRLIAAAESNNWPPSLSSPRA